MSNIALCLASPTWWRTGPKSSDLVTLDTLVRVLITVNGSETISIHTIARAILLKSLPSSYAPIRSIIQNTMSEDKPALKLKTAMNNIAADDKEQKRKERMQRGEAYNASISSDVLAKIFADAAARDQSGPRKCKCNLNAKNSYRCLLS